MEQKTKPPSRQPQTEPPKSGSAADRLRGYLQKLTPGAQAMLARELERALERGEDAAVATMVLAELRGMLRPPDASQQPRLEELSRSVFGVLDPFLVDTRDLRPGQIRRTSLLPLWTWLIREGLPQAVLDLERTLSSAHQEGRSSDADRAIRKLQIEIAERITKMATPSADNPDSARTLTRIGGPALVEDVMAIATVLIHRDTLDTFRTRMPGFIRAFGEMQVMSIRNILTQLPALQKPELAPFTLALVMQRLTSPWQIIRLAISFAGSDEEGRVAASPFAATVSMALQNLGDTVGSLRSDTQRGHFDACAHHLKALHDGVRDMRTELDLRADSAWSRQLAAIRIDISNTLTSEIESVPGRVRRLLRQRSDKDINAGARLDISEVDETAALINFVATCRTYANELAINEVTLRAFSDLQHYIETATESLVESLRSGDDRIRAFRQSQVEVAIRFCEVIFGHDYASLMTKAADVALSGERKAPKAG